MKYHVDVHLYGSDRGYKELAASAGLSEFERDILRSTGFGDVSDQNILNSLEIVPTACGRPLPTGRVAITRCFEGPRDDGGRPTIELRTIVLNEKDWNHLRAGRIELFLNNSTIWNRQKFLHAKSINLHVSNDQQQLQPSIEMYAMYVSLSDSPSSSYACASTQNTDLALFTLLSKLPRDDSQLISWGVRMTGTGLKLSMSTLHSQLNRESNVRAVNLGIPKSKTMLAREFLEFSGILPTLGYKVATHQFSNSDKATKRSRYKLIKNKKVVISVWVLIIIAVIAVIYWPAQTDSERTTRTNNRTPRIRYPDSVKIEPSPTKDPKESSIEVEEDEVSLPPENKTPASTPNPAGMQDVPEKPLDFIDCDNNKVPDTEEIANGAADCNGNGVLDECEIEGNDCNGNGVPDDCDIADGTSEDCNGNGIPDECELVDNDCNGNGVPDSCELADGAADCNENNILDICELLENDINNNDIPDDCDFEISFTYSEFFFKMDKIECLEEFDTTHKNYRDIYTKLLVLDIENPQQIYQLTKGIDTWKELLLQIDNINALARDKAKNCEEDHDDESYCQWLIKGEAPFCKVRVFQLSKPLPEKLILSNTIIELLRNPKPNYKSMVDEIVNGELNYKNSSIESHLERVDLLIYTDDQTLRRLTILTEWKEIEVFKDAIVSVNAKCIKLFNDLETERIAKEEKFAKSIKSINEDVEKLSLAMDSIIDNQEQFRSKGILNKVLEGSP